MSTAPKPTLCVATLGAAGHGKTALTNALVTVLGARGAAAARAEVRGPAVVDPMHGRWLSVFGADCVRYESARRCFVQLDFDGDPRFARVMPAILAATRPDVALVVVSAFEGVTDATRAQLTAAREAGVASIVGYVSHADREEGGAAPDVAEQDVRETLSESGFDGDAAPMIAGASHEAAAGHAVWTPRLDALVEALDAVPLGPSREGPLRFVAPLRVAFACVHCGAPVSRVVTAWTSADPPAPDDGDDEAFGLPPTVRGAVLLNRRRRGYYAQPGDLCFDPADAPDLLRPSAGYDGWGDPERVELACAGRDLDVSGWATAGTLSVVVLPRRDVVAVAPPAAVRDAP